MVNFTPLWLLVFGKKLLIGVFWTEYGRENHKTQHNLKKLTHVSKLSKILPLGFSFQY